MKVMYSKTALKAAAVYIAVNNPHLSTDWRVIYKSVKQRLLKEARRNAYCIEHYYLDDWTSTTSTGGIMFRYSHDGEYIDVDIYVTPTFAECRYVEKEL